MEPDFSGYATKAGLRCTDGRTIMPDAFKHQDKMTVPLVWQHGHDDPGNVLGHVELENRTDGVYCKGFFNATSQGKSTKELVQHGDIKFLSIYANQLVERAKQVFHGAIREVSLVLAGANPGALIDFVRVAHSDGSYDDLEDEAIIYTGLELSHSAGGSDKADGDKVTHADGDTVQDVLDSMNEEQRNVLAYLVGKALDEGNSASHSDDDSDDDNDDDDSEESDDSDDDDNDDDSDDSDEDDDNQSEDNLNHQEDADMARNVFDQSDTGAQAPKRKTLTHSQISTIVEDAKKPGMTLKSSLLAHADEYGIGNIDLLFPDAKTVFDSPEFISRRMEWVQTVIAGTKHSPFSRIKTLSADITQDEARAKGYIKGHLKKEEYFALTKRVTTPTTIYKKQKLDRDDIIDITDLDVVAWLKAEMRVMLDEEIARAILIGDGRDPDDEDKVRDGSVDGIGIRPIATDVDFYTTKVQLPANVSAASLVEQVLTARQFFKGSGTPTLFTTVAHHITMLLAKDKMGRRLYNSDSELALAMGVSKIVEVELLEGQTTDNGELLGIIVNLQDYVVGADRGGQVSMFDDFDIDYNQYKYLMEGRMSGALVKAKSAILLSRAAGTSVTPAAPTFNSADNEIAIPTTTGVVYKVDGEPVTDTVAVTAQNTPVTVDADPADNYYFPANSTTTWTFDYVAH